MDETQAQLNQIKQQPQQPETTTESGTGAHKQELDTLKMRFLQSQVENEKLKKELASVNTTAKIGVQQSASTSSTVISSGASVVPKSAQPGGQLTSTGTASTTASPASVPTVTQTGQGAEGVQQPQQVQSQPPPTAYIAPSRITKVRLLFSSFFLLIN